MVFEKGWKWEPMHNGIYSASPFNLIVFHTNLLYLILLSDSSHSVWVQGEKYEDPKTKVWRKMSFYVKTIRLFTILLFETKNNKPNF